MISLFVVPTILRKLYTEANKPIIILLGSERPIGKANYSTGMIGWGGWKSANAVAGEDN